MSCPEPVHRRRLLFEGLGVAVVDFRCRAHVEPHGAEEANETHSIALVRRGVFGRVRRREQVLADANQVLFFDAGEGYRYSHPLPGGDDCTVLALHPDTARELIARHAPRDGERAAVSFRSGVALASPRLAALHHELLGLAGRQASRLEQDDALAELAAEALRCAYGAPARRAAGPRARERVEAVQVALNRDLTAAPDLGSLARGVECSPFHLSRSFHAHVGVTLRRYAKRLRVRAAAERLRGGERDLSRLALELGYADHSHFTHAFREEWGVPPAAFRGRGRRAQREAGGTTPQQRAETASAP